MSAWSWMESKGSRGQCGSPGAQPGGGWAGTQAPSQMFAPSSGRCSGEAPNRYTAKGLPPNSREQTAEGPGNSWEGLALSSKEAGTGDRPRLPSRVKPRKLLSTYRADRAERSQQPEYQGVIIPLAQHGGRCPGHV